MPFGRPAQAALRAWRGGWTALREQATAGRRAPASEEPLFVNLRGERLTDRSVRRILDRYVEPRPPRRAASIRTPCATPSPPTCSSAAPTCARSRSCSATARSRRPSATPTSTSSACWRSTVTPTRAPARKAGRARDDRTTATAATTAGAAPGSAGRSDGHRARHLRRAPRPLPRRPAARPGAQRAPGSRSESSAGTIRSSTGGRRGSPCCDRPGTTFTARRSSWPGRSAPRR